jgi:hypothetical protein
MTAALDSLWVRTLRCMRQGIRVANVLRRDSGWHAPPCGARQTSRVDARQNPTCPPHSEARPLHGEHFSAKSAVNKSRSNPNAPAVRVYTLNRCVYACSHVESRRIMLYVERQRYGCPYPGSLPRAHSCNGIVCLRDRCIVIAAYMMQPLATCAFAPSIARGKAFVKGRHI